MEKFGMEKLKKNNFEGEYLNGKNGMEKILLKMEKKNLK